MAVVPNESKVEYRLHVLEKDNYTIWKQHMKNVLEAKGLLEAVEGTSHDAAKESQARALITSALSADNQMKVINCRRARDIWRRLEAIYENKSSFEKENLLNKLHSYKIHSAKDIPQAISEIETLSAKLKLLGETVSDEAQMSAILRALPKSFKTFITVWKGTARSERTIDNLLTRLMAEVEDNDREDHALILNAKMQKLTVNNKPRKAVRFNKPQKKGFQSKVVCYNCNKPGHMIKDCRSPRKDGNPRPNNKFNKNRWFNNRRYDSGNTRNIAMMAIENEIATWIIDSRASLHITPNREWIQDYQEFEQEEPISGVGGEIKVYAKGKGNVKTTVGTICDVHYVPESRYSLFSESAAALKGLTVKTEYDTKVVTYRGQVIFKAHLSDGLYIHNFSLKQGNYAIVLKKNSLEDWHKKLGHVNVEAIKKMANDTIVNGLKLESEEFIECQSCIRNKCTKVTHQTRTTPKAKRSGNSLHIDTKGPLKTSLGGAKYAVVCKDECSGYRQVAFVSHKSDIPDEVLAFISNAEIETGNPVLQVNTDNGSEFVNEQLQRFFKKRGIIHKRSVAMTPEQNGYIERDIRTIFESGKTMLNEANLPVELWAEAIQTAVYVLNRTIKSKGDKTPYEKWTGVKPDVGNLHIFGQYAIVMDNRRAHKLDENGIELIFVGYTDRSNTYRFYDVESSFVTIKCDARFINKFAGQDIDREEVIIEDYVDNDKSVELPPIRQRSKSDPPSPSDKKPKQDMKTKKENMDKDGGRNKGTVPNPSKQGQLKKEERKSQPQVEKPVPSPRKHKPDSEIGDKEKDESISSISTEHDSSNNSDPRDAIYQNIDQIRQSQIPKQLYIRDKPPEVLDNKLRDPKTGTGHKANLATSASVEDPKTFEEAINRSDKDHWINAMQEEMNSLAKNGVWNLVDRPKGNVVTSKWVFVTKRKPNGQVDRYKARLVARGFSQHYGTDYSETYAPVVDCTSVRILFAYAAANGLKIGQFDVKTAFLYGDLNEEIYMEQPEGFCEDNTKVWKLEKSLYGLKQAPRCWNEKFSQVLREMGLKPSKHDYCIYYRTDPILIVAIYVDDGIIIAEMQEIIDEVIKELQRKFEIHSVDPTTYLGFQVDHNIDGTISLYQESYVGKMLKRFDMMEARPVDNPCSTVVVKDSKKLDPSVPYRELIGSLMYAANITRIDIAYATGKVSRQAADPTEADWTAAKRILRYLREKENFCLRYARQEKLQLEVFCDADFAGDADSAKSTTGFVILLGGSPIHWKSKRQTSVAKSSTEAELISLNHAVEDTMWIKKLALELQIINEEPVPVYCDNQSTVRIVTDEKSMHRTRHMKVKAGYVREKIEQGEITVTHIKADEQLADMLTKPMTGKKFTRDRNLLMSMLSFMVMIASILSIANCMTFDQVTPIVWTKLRNYASPGLNMYNVMIKFINPCLVIESIQGPPVTKFRERKGIEKRQVYLPSAPPSPVQVPAQQPYQAGEQPGDPYGYANNVQKFQNPLQNQNAMISSQPEIDFLDARNQAIMHCNQIYQEFILDPIEDMNRTFSTRMRARNRRSIVPDVIKSVVSALFYSNVLKCVLDKVWPGDSNHELMERERLVEEKIHKLNQAMNVSHLMDEAIGKSLQTMAENTKFTNKRLSAAVHYFPELFFTTNLITSRMIAKSTELRHLTRIRKLDITALSIILDTDIYDNLVETSVFAKNITSPAPGVLSIQFIGREKDQTTDVIRADPIRFWSNLTGLPCLMEYAGDRYLIYNRSNNCVTRIETPSTEYVEDKCQIPHYEDPNLSKWISVLKMTDPYSQPANTTVKHSWPYVYIYCFRLMITVNHHTYECPPYVFKLNNTISWNTTDRVYEASEKKVAKEVNFEPITHEIHAVHFRDNEHIIDQNLAIREVIRLNKERDKLIQESVALTLPIAGAKLSYSTALEVMLWMTGLGFISMFAIIIYRYYEDRKKHQKVMKTMTDGIYGDGTYEMVRATKRHRTHSETSCSTVPAQVHVTVNGSTNSNIPQPPPLPRERGTSSE